MPYVTLILKTENIQHKRYWTMDLFFGYVKQKAIILTATFS